MSDYLKSDHLKIDYSMMICYLDDADAAIIDLENSGREATSGEMLLLAIVRSLQAIAVALVANHAEDRYP